MTKLRSSRARVALVLCTAAVVVAGSTTFAAAHHGTADGTLHACANKSDGQLRLLTASGQTCRSGETAVQWSAGSDSAAQLASFAARLKADEAQAPKAPNDNDGYVHWNNLEGVPSSTLTAGDDLSAFVATLKANRSGGPNLQTGLVHWTQLLGVPPWLADGSVDFAELTGQVTGAQLALSSVAGGTVADGSLTADDLAGRYSQDPTLVVQGAVTGEKVLDGTLEARDLGAGSVTADELSLPYAVASDAAPSLLAEGANYPLTPAALTATARSQRVLVSAQAQVTCTACSDPLVSTAVSYQVVRLGPGGAQAPVSPAYTVTLSAARPDEVLSLSALDAVSAGDVSYALRVATAAAQTAVSGVVVSAQVVSG